ncbi:beta-lactamase/transpeptidase-like protein [Clavulina sp. PMI_390]|nr:beta-lactamase/transpeptidase-like protein [Clavulina sp. PMI_390]
MWARTRQTALIGPLVLLNVLSAWAIQLPLRPLPTPGASLPPANATSARILDEDFETWLSNVTSVWGLKGLSIAVVKRHDDDDSWQVEAKGYGVKNAAGDPVTADTTFAICSNSKLFTTLALGKLIDEGATLPNSSITLKWSTKISDILGDDWQLKDKVAERYADLVDIMSHRTGLPAHDLGWLRGHSTAQTVKNLRYFRPSKEFRQGWQYTNLMYITMAEIVERVSGRPFIKFIQEEMMDKLPFSSATMNSTLARTSGHLSDGFVQIRRNVSDGMGLTNSTYQPVSFFIDDAMEGVVAGPAGATMSAKDSAIWLQTLLMLGRNPDTGDSVVPEPAVLRAASGETIKFGDPTDPELSVRVYGGGQEQYAYQGHNIVQHTGGWAGWVSVISRAPQDGVGVSVFTNWDNSEYVVEMIKYYLYEKALGLPHVDWNSRFRAIVAKKLEAERRDSISTIPSSSPEHWSTLIALYLGTYHHGAYGTYELCPPPSSHHAVLPRCAGSDDFWHKVVKSEVSTSSQPPVIGIVVAASLFNYINLIPTQSPTKFKLEGFEVTTAPTPTSPTNRYRSAGDVVYPMFGLKAELEFSLNGGEVEGFGITGVWGAHGLVEEISGETVKERAEVWFDRVR